MRSIAILGSTGSIGTQALDLCARYPERFRVHALIARQSRDKLFEQVRRFRPALAGLTVPIPVGEIPADLRFCEWVFGEEALRIAAASDCDDVLVCVVGMVGLSAVMEAFRHHKRVLLANKEALVAGGHLVMEAAAKEAAYANASHANAGHANANSPCPADGRNAPMADAPLAAEAAAKEAAAKEAAYASASHANAGRLSSADGRNAPMADAPLATEAAAKEAAYASASHANAGRLSSADGRNAPMADAPLAMEAAAKEASAKEDAYANASHANAGRLSSADGRNAPMANAPLATDPSIRLLPVDSEHSAIFQCLQGAGGNRLSRIALTCSGGPFRTWSKEQIRSATRAQALRHPTWNMGQKITIDSATLFNKGLEMMEAGWLFSASAEQIEVLVHPQSIVHSGVYFADGALIAQLGTPDMHLPILYAMSYPERLPTGGRALRLTELASLTFEQPDEERFPSLRLARECMKAGGAAGCIFNAANETAVFRLLEDEGMPIGRIYDTVEEVLSQLGGLPADSLEEVFEADRRAREAARAYLEAKR